jgi:hypothetical protein
MRDGPIRRVLKRIALSRYTFDLWFTRLLLRARGEPRYRLTGACNGCGRCCETPVISVSAPVFLDSGGPWSRPTCRRRSTGSWSRSSGSRSESQGPAPQAWGRKLSPCVSTSLAGATCRSSRGRLAVRCSMRSAATFSGASSGTQWPSSGR